MYLLGKKVPLEVYLKYATKLNPLLSIQWNALSLYILLRTLLIDSYGYCFCVVFPIAG